MEINKQTFSSELARGSLILFVMLGVFNILNYTFQISMARLLGPKDYGILAVLMSIIYIFGIPNEAIQTIVTKYTSKFNIKKEYGKMKDLMYRSMKKGFLAACIIFLLYVPTAYFLSGYLGIDFILILLIGSFIFYVFSVPIIRGIIQGRKKFTGLGTSLVMEGFVKVSASVILVLIGWKVYGAVIGLILSGFFAFVLSFPIIKEVLISKRERENFHEIYKTNIPILICISCIVFMYSLDVIIAKRFFSPEVAGQYAFISMIGKAIIFISLAVSKAMFPISSEKHESGEKTTKLFKKSLFVVSALSLCSLLLYLFFPEQIVKILSVGSTQYLGAANILFIVGLSFSFISIANVIILYGLSVDRIKKSSFFLIFFVILEVVLLSLFNSSLLEFSISLLIASFSMLLYSILVIRRRF
ncbi:MAG: oligosaccharide flippase family protein [archaeon]|nr:oligosaccharide flippase family protein [archaeon]